MYKKDELQMLKSKRRVFRPLSKGLKGNLKNLFSMVLIFSFSSVLLLSCGEDDNDGELLTTDETGTHELVDGFTLDDVLVSNEPVPVPDNNPESPVIENVYWDEAVGSGEIELVVEFSSKYPVESFHIKIGDGNHIVIPTNAYFNDPISFDLCESFEQVTGVSCTESCIAISTNFKECSGSADFQAPPGMTETEFIRQWFAATCSQEVQTGNIGPDGIYDSEYDYYWKLWLGNQEFIEQGLYESLGFTCETVGGSPSSNGNQSETVRKRGFTNRPLPDIPSAEPIVVSAQSSKPSRNGSQVLTGGHNKEGATLSCIPKNPGVQNAVPGQCQ